MAPRIKDMTQGNPLTLIITFSLPLMLGSVFQQLYTVVDTMVVGKGLGVDALAALGATDWLYWLILGVVMGVTQGFAILMARHFGAKDYVNLRKVVGGSALLSALCALVLMVLGQLAVSPVLELLGTPEQIVGTSKLYLRVILLGMPAVMAYNLFSCILRSLGDSRTPLNALIVSSVTNIVLDLLFVLVLRWGVAGAAAATIIAQISATLLCLHKLLRIDILQLQREDFRPDPALAGRLLALGAPMAFQNIIIAVGGMIIQSVVNGYGVAFIGGFTATNKLYGLLELAATSYGYALITYVGQNLGAGRMDRIRSGMTRAVLVALATSAVIAAAMLLFGRGLVRLFLSGTPEEVTQAARVAYTYLCVMSVCLPVLYILHVTRSAVQGMGNTVLPMVSGIAEFVMRTGGILLLPAILGENGIFAAEVLAWAGADLILIPSYFITVRATARKLRTGEEAQ